LRQAGQIGCAGDTHPHAKLQRLEIRFEVAGRFALVLPLLFLPYHRRAESVFVGDARSVEPPESRQRPAVKCRVGRQRQHGDLWCVPGDFEAVGSVVIDEHEAVEAQPEFRRQFAEAFRLRTPVDASGGDVFAADQHAGVFVQHAEDVLRLVATHEHQQHATLLELQNLSLEKLEASSRVIGTDLNPVAAVFGEHTTPQHAVGIEREDLGQSHTAATHQPSQFDPEFLKHLRGVRRAGDDFEVGSTGGGEADLFENGREIDNFDAVDLGQPLTPAGAQRFDGGSVGGGDLRHGGRQRGDDKRTVRIAGEAFGRVQQ